MKVIASLLVTAASIAAMSPSLIQPAAAQWGAYGLSQQQLREQRGNGWSSGDYFGAPQLPRQEAQPYGDSYIPGMQNNVRYRQNSCAIYINC